MKEFSELIFVDDLRYTDDHEWITAEGETLKVGITDYAQDQLGDIVFVEVPEVGDELSKGDEFGTVESVKAVSELYLPVSGEVVAVNEDLEDSPELVNADPYKNWLIEIRPSNPAELDDLLTVQAYKDILKG